MTKALTIDDSRAMRALISRMLTGMGFEVETAEHGQAGLECLDNSTELPDLVLVDINMPVMNGYDFVATMRADEHYANVPVIVVTSETEMSQVMRCLDAGADEYLMKPFTADALHDKLAVLGVVVS